MYSYLLSAAILLGSAGSLMSTPEHDMPEDDVLYVFNNILSDKWYTFLLYCRKYPHNHDVYLVKELLCKQLRLLQKKRDNPLRRYYLAAFAGSYILSQSERGSLLLVILGLLVIGFFGAILDLEYAALGGNTLIERMEKVFETLEQPVCDNRRKQSAVTINIIRNT